MEAIASLTQYYDQPLRCFTFGDFQLVLTVEEFEEILGCSLGGRNPYLFSGFYPSLEGVVKVVKISVQELDHVKLVMQSYPARALDRRLQEDWAKNARESPRVLMSLRVDFGPMS